MMASPPRRSALQERCAASAHGRHPLQFGVIAAGDPRSPSSESLRGGTTHKCVSEMQNCGLRFHRTPLFEA
jgi:hypothetical protein